MDSTLVCNVLCVFATIVVASWFFMKGCNGGGAVCYVLAFFLVLCEAVCIANPDMNLRTSRKIGDSVESVNYGELDSNSTNKVKKVDGAYVVVKDGNTYKELKDIEFVDDDGNIYVKSSNTESISDQAEEKVYVLDGKHYVDAGDGTLREVQVQPVS